MTVIKSCCAALGLWTLTALPAMAQGSPVPYLPQPATSRSDPELWTATQKAFDAGEETRLAGQAALRRIMKSGDFRIAEAAGVSLALSYNAIRDDVAMQQSLIDCVLIDPAFSDCQVWLGITYRYGENNVQSYAKSLAAFQAAADAGDAPGQWYLGMAHLNGLGIEKDPETAYDWITKAARQDFVPALVSYGIMNADGDGTDKNEPMLFIALARAAHLGDTNALWRIGQAYEKGLGTSIDRNMADSAYLLAAKRGDKQAVAMMKKMMSEIPKEDFQELYERATALEPKLQSVLREAYPFGSR